MRMPVQRQRRLVLVDCALQPRAAQEGEDRLRLADHGLLDRRIVHDRDLDRRLELLQPVIELHRLALRDLDKVS